jgi:transposase InsO family protein
VARQLEERRNEQAARGRVAAVSRQLTGVGWRWSRVAGLFRITARTLRRWCRRDAPVLLGRPVRHASPDARNAVIHFLDEHGPHVGVPTLRECFPAISRAELTDLVRRYRRVWRRRHRVPLRVLSWPVVGSVWAIDFTGPRPAVEGRYPYLLAVRDLASGRQLLWRPVEAATAAAAVEALASLFAEHGAPLVVKCDNGPPFTSAAAERLLGAHGVVALHSPPYWPRYNGSVEAGIGSLKDRTAAWAARGGRAGDWTWDDAAGACAEANALSRPRGAPGPSPDELWAARRAITAEERAAFGAAVDNARRVQERPAASCAAGEAVVRSRREMARCAIRLALEGCGYIHYKRRSIPPPL